MTNEVNIKIGTYESQSHQPQVTKNILDHDEVIEKFPDKVNSQNIE